MAKYFAICVIASTCLAVGLFLRGGNEPEDIGDAPPEEIMRSSTGAEAEAEHREVETTSPNAKQHSGSVEFEGHDAVPVRFWPFETRIPPPPLRLVDNYDDLVLAANSGDAPSAFALYQNLARCQNAYSDKKALDAAIEKLYAERVFKTPDAEKPTHIGDGYLGRYEEMLTTNYYRCDGITQMQRFDEAEKWLDVAADAGFLPAVDRISWTLYENGEFDEALRFLQQAWLGGSVESVAGLYQLYKTGGGTVQANSVEAAAYLYLQDTLVRTKLNEFQPGGVIDRMLNRTTEQLERELEGLRPSEVEFAIARAREILVSNPRCCVDW